MFSARMGAARNFLRSWIETVVCMECDSCEEKDGGCVVAGHSRPHDFFFPFFARRACFRLGEEMWRREHG